MGFLQLINSWMFIFPIIVILYYFFRKKYERHVISSTLFWEEAMQETQASPYLKKLQKNALLFLQVAALIFWVLAMMNPFIKSSVVTGQQAIFVVDTSASMLAGEEEPLFDVHKKKLFSLIEQADGKEITVITTGSQPSVLVRSETSVSAVKQVVEKLEVTYEAAHMENVLDVVQSFIGSVPTSVFIFTDSIEKTSLPVMTENVSWSVYAQEKQLDNVSISKFAAITQNNESTVLLKLTNDSDEQKKVLITVQDEANKKLTDEVTIEPNGTVNHVLNNVTIGQQLKAMIDVDDDYAADNVAYSVMQQPNIEVLLDADMHVLIQKGFTSAYDNVVYLQGSELANRQEPGLIVTNKVAYLTSKQPTLLIGRDDVEAIEVNQFVSSSNHALFTFSPLEDVYVQSVYPAFEDYEVIATVGEYPFIQISDRGDIIVLADIQATDWALHPVFPLFLWSAVQQMTMQSDYIGAFTPKQNASIVVPENEWSIFTYNDQFIQVIPSSKQFVAPEKPGIYKLQSKDEMRIFSVDIESEEKLIPVGQSYQIGSVVANQSEQKENSLLLWIIPIILILLLVEWEVQRRRGFTN